MNLQIDEFLSTKSDSRPITKQDLRNFVDSILVEFQQTIDHVHDSWREVALHTYDEGRSVGIILVMSYLKEKNVYFEPSKIPNPRETKDWEAALKAKIPKRPTGPELAEILDYSVAHVWEQMRLHDLEHGEES